MDSQTHQEFLIDLEQLVEKLFPEIDELREHEDYNPRKRELLGNIFRHVHSIKGIAATAEFNEIARFAHQIENLLHQVRSGNAKFGETFLDKLDQAAAGLSAMLDAVVAGTSAEGFSGLLFRNELSEQDDPLMPALPSEFADTLDQSERTTLIEALRQDEKLYLVTAIYGVASFDQEFNELRSSLTQTGTVISSLPFRDENQPGHIGFKVLYSSTSPTAKIEQRLNTSCATLQLLVNGNTTRKAFASNNPAAASNSVRVEIEELDHLISSAHRLFGKTVAALDLVSDRSDSGISDLDAQIRESLIALEENIIQLRMVPLDRVIQRAIRSGRVAARVSHKNIKFVSIGGTLRVDKTLADGVADPLMHLVRNAVDQGIEPADERLSRGKSAQGVIGIEASSDAGKVRLLVIDDGRGIDPDVVSRAAAIQGLIPEGTVLSEDRSLRMIFRPGFSTADQISTLSGRGVGLDIVENVIERIGGAVRVHTELGKGTTFEIRLPVSLGVMRALIVTANNNRYCIEAASVLDRFASADELREDSVTWKGRQLPLVHLNKLFPSSNGRGSNSEVIVVCRSTEASEAVAECALKIDKVEGTQEILVRGLGSHSSMWRGVTGAAELWDGTVALVLDLPLLLREVEI